MSAPLGARRWGAGVALALACLAPEGAEASEGENALSASLMYARFALAADEDVGDSGAALGIDYERGLTRALWLRGSGGFGVFPEGDLTYSGHGTLGLTYALDVVRYVPYVNLGVGAVALGGGGVDTDVYPLVELGGGVDVLHSRSLSYGIQVRFESFIAETALFTAGARVTYRWGFF